MDVVDNSPASLADRLFGTRKAMLSWAIASLVANIALIVTGATVRLTASGLGCDTWPRCNDDNYVAHGENGIHTYIEFGNRTLTFVLLAIAICTVVTARRSGASRKIWTLALLTLCGIPFQGVIGGITVLTHLNPWVVALHLLLTIVLVVWCTHMVLLARDTRLEVLPGHLRMVVVVLFWVLMFAIWVGTAVSGAGPHAGDLSARRNGLDILWIARCHSASVWVSVILTGYLIVQFRRLHHVRATRWSMILMGTLLLQGAIGYAQYFNGLPVGLVICHMLGIGLVTTAASWLYHGTRSAA